MSSSLRSVQLTSNSKPTAMAFDAFPIFDPRPISVLAEQLFPGMGNELSNTWRTRQFEYQWLRALSQHYVGFWQCTQDSLIFAADFLKLKLTPDKQRALMNVYLQLKPWPEVIEVLKFFREIGIRLALLSNVNREILETGISHSGLDNIFEFVLSTNDLETYKPDPRAYQMAIDSFRLKKEEILFVAFAGWDAAGAKAFGYRTFWVNRMNLPAERLGVSSDGVGSDLYDLARFVGGKI